MNGWMAPACCSDVVLKPTRMTTTARTNFCHQGPLSLKVGRLVFGLFALFANRTRGQLVRPQLLELVLSGPHFSGTAREFSPNDVVF